MSEHAHSDLMPFLPEQVPRFGGPVARWIGRLGLRTLGWRIEGEFPNIPKTVFAAAPHTSNWDFIIAMFAVLAMGVKISYLMKKEAFFWPFKGLFMSLGGIPIDRSAASDTVDQAGQWFKQNEKLWVVVTPEGTRAKVERWKTGFLRIAEAGGVPVCLVAWDYPSKRIIIEKTWHPSGDHARDADDIKDYICKKYKGRNPQYQ
jgi:1-acyl-sn-glycerol-3-phosphate acyltransferase